MESADLFSGFITFDGSAATHQDPASANYAEELPALRSPELDMHSDALPTTTPSIKREETEPAPLSSIFALANDDSGSTPAPESVNGNGTQSPRGSKRPRSRNSPGPD